MPRYLIAISVSTNRFRRMSRWVEAPDEQEAQARAIRTLERARRIQPAQTSYDTWTVSTLDVGAKVPKVLATHTIRE